MYESAVQASGSDRPHIFPNQRSQIPCVWPPRPLLGRVDAHSSRTLLRCASNQSWIGAMGLLARLLGPAGRRAWGRTFMVALMIVLLGGIERLTSPHKSSTNTGSLRQAASEMHDSILLWKVEDEPGTSAVPKQQNDGGVSHEHYLRDGFGICPANEDYAEFQLIGTVRQRVDRDSAVCSELRWSIGERSGGSSNRGSGHQTITAHSSSHEAGRGELLPVSMPQPVLSAAACSFLRLRLALRRPEGARVGWRPPQEEEDLGSVRPRRVLHAAGSDTAHLGTGRSHSSSAGVSTAPVIPSWQAVCGVNITWLWLDSACGALLATPSEVHTARDTHPFSRSAPKTHFFWNKAVAAGCDVSPHRMIDDGREFDVEDYGAAVQGFPRPRKLAGAGAADDEGGRALDDLADASARTGAAAPGVDATQSAASGVEADVEHDADSAGFDAARYSSQLAAWIARHRPGLARKMAAVLDERASSGGAGHSPDAPTGLARRLAEADHPTVHARALASLLDESRYAGAESRGAGPRDGWDHSQGRACAKLDEPRGGSGPVVDGPDTTTVTQPRGLRADSPSVQGPAITIYVVTTQLQPFFAHIYPLLSMLRLPFILVTGSSDFSAPLGGLAMGGSLEDARHTLETRYLLDPLLWAWFAQNPDYVSSKVVPLPIGFDFHTLANQGLPDEMKLPYDGLERRYGRALADGEGTAGQDRRPGRDRIPGQGHDQVAESHGRPTLEPGDHAATADPADGSGRAGLTSDGHDDPADEPDAGVGPDDLAQQNEGLQDAEPPHQGRRLQQQHSWGPALSAQAQDWSLQLLRCWALPPLEKREVAGLLNFNTAGRGVRSQVASLLGGKPGFRTLMGVKRQDLWREYGQYSFILSPRGFGKDCHRTWEAIALGSIPIVSADAFLQPLYEVLPVVVVERWADVSHKAMTRWKDEVTTRLRRTLALRPRSTDGHEHLGSKVKAAAGGAGAGAAAAGGDAAASSATGPGGPVYHLELLRTDWWLAQIRYVAASANEQEATMRLRSMWRYDGPGPDSEASADGDGAGQGSEAVDGGTAEAAGTGTGSTARAGQGQPPVARYRDPSVRPHGRFVFGPE